MYVLFNRVLKEVEKLRVDSRIPKGKTEVFGMNVDGSVFSEYPGTKVRGWRKGEKKGRKGGGNEREKGRGEGGKEGERVITITVMVLLRDIQQTPVPLPPGVPEF